jgi:predicted nucleic acid-binding protein
MATYLPDTNILIDALNGKRGRRELLRELLLQGQQLAGCSVTVAEVYSGMRPHEALKTDQFLNSLLWFDTSYEVARRAGRIRFDWARRGATLSLADTLIAAVALEHDLTLITSNRKDFPVPDLKLYPVPDGVH